MTSNNEAQGYFTISDLAKEFGVTLRSLRFYEEKGLIHPKRDGQKRLYNQKDRKRIGMILQGKKAGFSLSDIRDMISFYSINKSDLGSLKNCLAKFQEHITILQKRKFDIEYTIKQLNNNCSIIYGLLNDSDNDDRGNSGDDDSGGGGEKLASHTNSNVSVTNVVNAVERDLSSQVDGSNDETMETSDNDGSKVA